MGDYLWKCEACDGWLDLRRGLDAEQPLAAAMECSCPSPDIQQRIRPLKAIEFALLECERVLAQFSRMQRLNRANLIAPRKATEAFAGWRVTPSSDCDLTNARRAWRGV
jgi:hypothetical protein